MRLTVEQRGLLYDAGGGVGGGVEVRGGERRTADALERRGLGFIATDGRFYLTASGGREWSRRYGDGDGHSSVSETDDSISAAGRSA